MPSHITQGKLFKQLLFHCTGWGLLIPFTNVMRREKKRTSVTLLFTENRLHRSNSSRLPSPTETRHRGRKGVGQRGIQVMPSTCTFAYMSRAPPRTSQTFVLSFIKAKQRRVECMPNWLNCLLKKGDTFPPLKMPWKH